MSVIKVIGVPSFAGCREETSETIDQHNGPRAIRAAYEYLASGFHIPKYFDDLGDISCGSTVIELIDAVQRKVTEILTQPAIPFLLGGAHTLTVGTLKAFASFEPNYKLIYFDAHPDIMPHAQINYGSSIFHALEQGYLRPEQIAFIGIRQIEKEEAEAIRKHNIFSLTNIDFERYRPSEMLEMIKSKLPPPYLLSIDLDCLDPSYAPGVTSPYPVGLSPREVLYLASELCREKTLGVELVELSPISDRQNETARIAAVFLQALSAVLAQSATNLK